MKKRDNLVRQLDAKLLELTPPRRRHLLMDLVEWVTQRAGDAAVGPVAGDTGMSDECYDRALKGAWQGLDDLLNQDDSDIPIRHEAA